MSDMGLRRFVEVSSSSASVDVFHIYVHQMIDKCHKTLVMKEAYPLQNLN